MQKEQRGFLCHRYSHLVFAVVAAVEGGGKCFPLEGPQHYSWVDIEENLQINEENLVNGKVKVQGIWGRMGWEKFVRRCMNMKV